MIYMKFIVFSITFKQFEFKQIKQNHSISLTALISRFSNNLFIDMFDMDICKDAHSFSEMKLD